MRIKSDIWVKAFIRRCMSEGAAAYIAASGDEHAGAIFIHIDNMNGDHWLYGPAPSGLSDTAFERRFAPCFKDLPVSQGEAGDFIARQKSFDPDLWVVELEDKAARHFLDDDLVML